MKHKGWIVAGIVSTVGAVAAGVTLRTRKQPSPPEPPAVASEPPPQAAAAEPEVAPVEAAAPRTVPPPDDAAAAAMRDQIGDARMRLREKAEAGVPEPARHMD